MSTTLQSPPAISAPPPLALPEESIWKRYSSRQEFPLSLGLSVVLHLAVAGAIALAGMLAFSFSAKAGPMEIEAVVFAGGGGSGENVGNPDNPHMLQDPVYFNEQSNDPRKELSVDPPLAIEKEGDTKIEQHRKESENLKDQLTQGQDKAGIAGSKGQGGRGGLGGKGDGFGPGEGDGFGPGKNPSKRFKRQARWILILPREDPEAFVKKLVDIKAILLIPDGDKIGIYKVCEDLGKRPVTFKSIDQVGVNKYNRLWYMSHSPTDAQYVATGLYLTNQPRWIAIFIPQDLEQEIARAEFNHKKMSEDELIQRGWVTQFVIDRRGDTWDVQIRYQGPKQK
jgi:hypothetical protein